LKSYFTITSAVQWCNVTLQGGKVTLQPQLFLNMRGRGAWNKQWRSFFKAWSESNKNK
jgi:hypothetical protein